MNDPTLKVVFPNDREMITTRSFNAPREMVFDAFSSCEHLQHWWGPRRMEMTFCELDFTTGGHYRFVHKDTDGTEYPFRGKFLEVSRPERIEQTFEFELMPGHISREVMTFSEQDGWTTITGHSCYDTADDMKGHIESGMEAGMIETFDRLEELLAKKMESGTH